MAITERAIDQLFSDLKKSCGGIRNDYFGLLYLQQEFGVELERAITQIAFGGNDYGIDGFHFDAEKRNLYLFQFKWSETYAQFKQSFKRIIEDGIERIFGARSQDQQLNQILLQLKSCLIENEAVIQLEIQERFREELGIYYERQEAAFENLTDAELDDQGITEYRAVELTRLARTFVASDGDIDKLTRFREIFEDDRIYQQVFNDDLLRACSGGKLQLYENECSL